MIFVIEFFLSINLKGIGYSCGFKFFLCIVDGKDFDVLIEGDFCLDICVDGVLVVNYLKLFLLYLKK